MFRYDSNMEFVPLDGHANPFLLTDDDDKFAIHQRRYYLDRGDFKTTGKVSSPRASSSASHRWPVTYSPSSRLSANRERSHRALDKRKIKGPILCAKGTARLRCSEGTFRVQKIYGDGNCMFRAVSYIVWQNEEEHQSLRSMVVQHIKDNWQEYGPFVMAEWNISECATYCDYMSIVGTFASELECNVATKLHHMNLSIYREIGDGFELERVFHDLVSPYYETARLLFTGHSDNGHYDVLCPVE